MSKSVFLFLFLSSASSDSKAVMRMYARTNSGDKAKTILALLIAHSTGVHGSSLILDGILSRSLSAFLSTDGYSLARSCQLAIEFRYVPTADVRLHDTIENGNGD
mmetsp:Transcript_22610/g.47900  ORF Transcript_22610/g.47900 Transcript_22610/m.47900 type:complete len:105 (+) Transcript_22610:602-916(+)